MTLLNALADQLTRASAVRPHAEARPRALLWTDEAREWVDVVPRLKALLPQFLVLGPYDPGQRQGPSIYLLSLLEANPESVPIFYLPGVGKATLRAVAELEWNLQPLAALQYQSLLWLQDNGKDWTRLAFATSERGVVRWQVAADEATKTAFRRSFLEWLDRDIAEGQGRVLNEGDFHRFLVDDVGAQFLKWMQTGENQSTAFGAEVKKTYQFDVRKQTNLDALAMLARGPSKAWEALWTRIVQAPRAHQPLLDQMMSLRPPTDELGYDESRYPSANRQAETELAQFIEKAATLPAADLRNQVLRWERLHGIRRTWLWSRLGQSRWAEALGPLAELAEATNQSASHKDFDGWRDWYTGTGWKADAAYLKVLAHPIELDQRDVYLALADRLYRPWLEEVAARFQALSFETYPRKKAGEANQDEEGTCVFFVDGLRWDLSAHLTDMLVRNGSSVAVRLGWAALPTVTATAKPAVSPLEHLLTGTAMPTTFDVIDTFAFRKQLGSAGYTYLPADELGTGSGRAWTESGAIDTKGHNGDLPATFGTILDEIAWRIQKLLEAGWQRVRVVTDHGWLLLPGGLPKTELPGVLTPNRGERAAWLHPGNPPTQLQAPWFWNPLLSFQAGPGISAFYANVTYAHGGLTLQECVIPELLVTRATGSETTPGSITLVESRWKGFWLNLVWSSLPDSFWMDLRLSPGDPGTSLLGGRQALSGKLVVKDDRHEGAEAWLVVEASGSQVVFQMKTKVGG